MKQVKAKKFSEHAGSTILELLLYLSLFTAVSLVAIEAMVVMARSFRETSVYAELVQSTEMLQKITREIRSAESITSLTSQDLKLTSHDAAGAARTIEFTLSGTDVRFLENDILVGNLNAPDVAVDALTFFQITTANGTGVKIAMTVHSKKDQSARRFDFADTVVLRGAY